ncbi:MAG: tetratricopeptide repeat protein [Myxococcota bacterium]
MTHRLRQLGALTLLLWAFGSMQVEEAAAAGKDPKKSKKEKDKDEDAPKGDSNKAELQAKTASGPTLKYEQFRKGVEIKVAEKRESQIDGLKRLLDSGPPEADLPDIKFRLAELYYEKGRFYFFRAQEAEEQAQKSKDPGQKDQLLGESKNLAKEVQSWDKKATDLYKEIAERYPKYERLPEVLFALGQTYWSALRYQDAIQVYTDLIRRFKDSPLVADAWLAFGEYYFNEGELNKALKAYELAAADKRSRVYGFALYKQAWCYYNLADWKKALEKFRATVFYSQMADTLSGENRISLAREAQKDFVKTYAFTGDEARAKFVLGDLTADEECKNVDCLRLLEMLAGFWYDTGKFEQSAHLYRELIRLQAESTRIAFYQSKVVDLVSRSAIGDKKPTINETKRLVELYQAVKAKTGSFSGEAAVKAKNDIDEAEVLAESTVRRLGQEWNREAKKVRSKATYEAARIMYSDYLALFPASKFAYEMRFQLADLLYKLEAFDEAAKAYEATVLADPKGKFLVEAANDNILALEEHLKDLNLKKPQVKDDKPIDIHPERKRLVDACDRYATLVPEDKADKLIAVMYKAAKIYYDHNHLDEATKRFEAIVERQPGAEEAEYSANLVIDTYNLKQDWNRLYDASSRYLKNETLIKGRDKLRDQLLGSGEYAKFKLVEILETDLKNKGSSLAPVAKAYEEFQAEFPKSKNADKALYNASVAWDSVGERDRAAGLRKKLMEEYKDSELRADVQYYAAKSFEERAEFAKAAELFEQFADAYPTDKRSRDALFNAGVFYAGVGQVKAANQLRTKYLGKFGKQKEGEAEAASIYFAMARDLERAERISDAVNAYADFTKKFPGDEQVYESLWREAQLRKTRLRQLPQAEKIENTLLYTVKERQKKGDKLPAIAADYASRIAFERLEKDFDKYTKVKIERPNLKNPAAFARSVEAKAKGREQIVKAYEEIVTGYQQAYSTIGSLYKIAQSWDNFVATLLAVPCPAGIDEQTCSFVKQGIEEKAAPARDSAKAAYKACVDKSNQLNVFTQYSTECVKVLERIVPDAYPEMVERRVGFGSDEKKVDVKSNSLILRYDAPGTGMPLNATADTRRGGEPGDAP